MRTGASAGLTDIAGETLQTADSADAMTLTFDVEAAP